MAQFSCRHCGHEAHFSDFKTGETHTENDGESDYEEDDLECPECGSSAVSED